MNSDSNHNLQIERAPGFLRRQWIRVVVYSCITLPLLVGGFTWHARRTLTMHEAAPVCILKELVNGVISLRCVDGDGNGFLDYWTADIAAIYAFEDVTGSKVCYIDQQLAEADVAPIRKVYSWKPPERPCPKLGYYYSVILLDENGNPYCQDPDGR